MRTKEEIKKYFSAHLCIKNIDIKDVIEIISSNAFFNWFNQENNKKEILVPSNIPIIKNGNRQLGIGFNECKQVLSFDKGVDAYQVLPVMKHDSFPQCKLVLCRYEDIKAGDIFTNSFALLNNLLTELDSYLIKLLKEDICFIQDSNCVITSSWDVEDCAKQKVDYYKLVEVDKK